MPGKVWVSLLAVLLGLLVPLGTGPAAAPEVPRMDIFKAMQGDPGVLIIDVRHPIDWKESSRKISGAQRYEPGEIASWAPRLLKDKKIVLHRA